jgi:hypothetical protein
MPSYEQVLPSQHQHDENVLMNTNLAAMQPLRQVGKSITVLYNSLSAKAFHNIERWSSADVRQCKS